MKTATVRILVVDDEPHIVRAVSSALAHRGYEVASVRSGEEAIGLTGPDGPDALLVDLGLPGMGGLELIRRVRVASAVPIVVLSARDDEASKVAALDLGADDYVTKPFGVEELMARLRAALRRAPEAEPVIGLFRAGPIALNADSREVAVDGRPVRLTPIEYELLRAFIERPNRVLTHRVLLERVWGQAYATEGHYLHVHVANLRRKVEPNPRTPRYLVTEPGVGYRLRTDDP